MRRSFFRRAGCAAGLLLVATSWSWGQTLKVRPPAGQDAEQVKKDAAAQTAEALPVTVPMSVPSGTPIKVALDSEVRIRDSRTVYPWQDHRAGLCLRQTAHPRRHCR